MLRNFLTLGSGEVAARGLHALAILFLARALKPEALGIFELAVSIMTYAVLSVQQGFDPIAMREVSRNRTAASGWLATVLRVRIGFALPVIAAMTLAGVLQRTQPIGPLLMILSLACVAAAVTPKWVFLGLERPRAPAMATIFSQIIFLATVALFVRQPEHAWRAALGWVAGEIAAAVLLRSQLSALIPARTPASLHSPVTLLKESWPVSLSMLLGQIMFNFDVIALALLGHSAEIGLYLAAYRFVGVFTPILQQFQASIFPPFARAHAEGPGLMTQVRKMAFWGAGIALLLSIGLYIAAPLLIVTLFGPEYAPSTRFLRVLAWALPLQVIRMVARQALIASHRQVSDPKIGAAGAATNIALDFALIPTLGAMGCAIATLCSGVAVVSAAFYFASRHQDAIRSSPSANGTLGS